MGDKFKRGSVLPQNSSGDCMICWTVPQGQQVWEQGRGLAPADAKGLLKGWLALWHSTGQQAHLHYLTVSPRHSERQASQWWSPPSHPNLHRERCRCSDLLYRSNSQEPAGLEPHSDSCSSFHHQQVFKRSPTHALHPHVPSECAWSLPTPEQSYRAQDANAWTHISRQRLGLRILLLKKQGHHKGSLSKTLVCGMNETCTLVLEPALVLSSRTERRKNVQLPKLAGKVLFHYLQGLTGWEVAGEGGEEQKLPPAGNLPWQVLQSLSWFFQTWWSFLGFQLWPLCSCLVWAETGSSSWALSFQHWGPPSVFSP